MNDFMLLFSQGCALDPLLDDSVMFAKRLRDHQRDVQLHLFDSLPHGFLNFTVYSKDAKLGSDKCASLLGELLSGNSGTD